MSELNTAKANLASAQSSLNYQSANMSRYQPLYKKGLVSADDYENALLTYRQAKEQVASAKENVQKAQTNLSYATITSPIDGTVISKNVEEGQTVAASFNTPELFTIAKVPGNSKTGSSGSYYNKQCSHLRGCHLCTQRRSQVKTRTDSKCYHLYTRTSWYSCRCQQSTPLYSNQGNCGKEYQDC